MKTIRLKTDRWISLGITCAGAASVAGIFHTSFSLPELTAMMLAACVLCCVFFFLLTIFDRKKRFILFCLLGMWIVCGFLFREPIISGGTAFVQAVSPYFMRALHYEADIWVPAATGASYLWFGLYALMPYALWLVWAVGVKNSAPAGIILTALPFACAYLLAGAPPDGFLTVLFIVWATLLLQARLPRTGKKGDVKIRLACLALCAAVFLSLFAAFPQTEYTPSPQTITLRNQIKETAAEIGYTLTNGSGGPAANQRGETDLDTTGSVVQTDNTVLRLRASEPQDIYLRGYAASEYTGHAWLPADASAFEESGVAIEPMTYLASEERGDAYFSGLRTQIRIEPVRSGSRWAFSPYQIAQVWAGPEQPEWAGDAYLAANGQDSYTFEFYGNGTQSVVITGSDAGTLSWLMRNMYNNGSRKTGNLEFEGYTLSYISTSQGPWIFGGEENVFVLSAGEC